MKISFLVPKRTDIAEAKNPLPDLLFRSIFTSAALGVFTITLSICLAISLRQSELLTIALLGIFFCGRAASIKLKWDSGSIQPYVLQCVGLKKTGKSLYVTCYPLINGDMDTSNLPLELMLNGNNTANIGINSTLLAFIDMHMLRTPVAWQVVLL